MVAHLHGVQGVAGSNPVSPTFRFPSYIAYTVVKYVQVGRYSEKRSTLSGDLMDQLKKYDSATISNAIEDFQVRKRTEGYTSWDIRCQFPELDPMVGYAVTCTMDSTTADQKGENRLHEFMDVLWASENPIVVVIQDVGPKTNSSCFAGDLICSVYSALGVVGLVTDGGVRDLKGIKEKAPGLQIFSPGVVVSHGNGIKIDINVPVVVGGMQIDPGDLIHGDGNGLVNVPISIAKEVVSKAAQVKDTETKLFDYLDNGSYDLEGLKRHIGRPTNA